MDEFDNFPVLQGELDDFTAAISSHLSLKERSVQETASRFKRTMAGLESECAILRDRLDRLEEQEGQMARRLGESRKSNDETSRRLETLRLQQQGLETQRSDLDKEVAELNRRLKEHELKWAKYKESLHKQRERDNPEVSLYENLLGMTITSGYPHEEDGPSDSHGTDGHHRNSNILTFTFSKFDMQDMDKKCSITIDIASSSSKATDSEGSEPPTHAAFEIVGTVPPLDRESPQLRLLAGVLNDEHDLRRFIIEARSTLVDVSSDGL